MQGIAYSLGAIAGLLMLCGCSRPLKKLVSGSILSTESSVLGEILAQHVQNKLGLPVERRTGMQGSLIAQQSLLSGEIDFYAEDSGTAYYSIFQMPLTNDRDMVNSRVPLEYKAMKIKWIAPLGYLSTFVMVASPELITASTLSRVEESGQLVSLSCTLEFRGRLDGFVALTSGYQIKLNGSAKLVDPNKVAEQVGQKNVHMGVVNSTDPVLLNPNIRILSDDKNVFAGYPVAVVVKEITLANNPRLEGVLKLLEGKLSLETILKLNSGVTTQGKTPAAVASEFLQQAGLR